MVEREQTPLNPPLNPTVMKTIERLRYRVTVGDVAMQSGLDLATTERDIQAIAAAAGGHLQVTDTGDIAYKFPENFREILRNKFWQLKFQEWLQGVWTIAFYLIRLAFGASLLILLTLVIIGVIVSISFYKSDSSRNDNDRSFGTWFNFNPFWLFDFNSFRPGQQRYREGDRPTNFLEAIFSFVFGDGDPNRDLEERRWQAIGQVIRQRHGVVIAEQVTPFLDELGRGFSQEYEEYMLPVLVRFGGSPEVSETGQLVYRFPELQKTATQPSRQQSPEPFLNEPFLKEQLWRFSNADGSLLMWAALLGILLLVLSLWSAGILPGALPARGVFRSIAQVAIGYSGFYLGVPLLRWFALMGKNDKISARNRDRQFRSIRLEEPDAQTQEKLQFAQQFAQMQAIDEANLAYTTERDLLDQEIEQRDKLDADWEKRLNESQKKKRQN
ncbi:hypothetical protein [Alkalinema sp. FACHB-956]|uniref:hypothetical protein n=1 Tax=Alkalinema sp. FACHB-956 TaxID=2692768 RepID=UPI001685010B|nr:hypothetical protein [Alkalinema sp. FACHB-956]MBD2330102.1 hypothetical protein [Alkalinema sp. FACHB-956]